MNPRILCCKCGSRLVQNDGHYICERYLEDIKQGVKQQQEIIDELNGLNDGEII
jgi:hypothetical protein